MIIDITLLNQNIEDSLYIDEDINLDISNYNTDIKSLKELHVKGYIYLDTLGNVDINFMLSGSMVLEDAISLDDVDYPFNIKIDEKIEKNEEKFENSVDLSDVLWQNIVLEVPLRFTKVSNLEGFKGEGWKLLDEDTKLESNNPFEELKSMFGEE